MQQISKLPALSTTYPLFDWNGSNGDATSEQTQQAYTAVTTKGLCSDFSRLVWNDMVKLLSGALSAAGLTWDSTYGTIANTLIPEYLGQLTAKRFNAMVCNVGQLYYPNWYWVTSGPGRIGRTYVKGSVDTGNYKIADGVYGKYLLELAEQLNLFLRVLQGDDGVLVRAVYQENLTSPHSANLFDAKAAFLSYQQSINTAIRADLFPGIAGFLQTNTISDTLVHANAQQFPAFFAHVGYISRSDISGDLRAKGVGLLTVNELAETTVDADLETLRSGRLAVQQAVQSLCSATIVSANWKYMTAEERALSSSVARLARYAAGCFGHQSISTARQEADVQLWRALFIDASDLAVSSHKATVLQFPFIAPTAAEKSWTTHNADAHAKRPRKAAGIYLATSESTGAVVPYSPVLAGSYRLSESQHNAAATDWPGEKLSASDKSASLTEAAVSAEKPVYVTGETRSKTQSQASAVSAKPTWTGAQELMHSLSSAVVNAPKGDKVTAEQRVLSLIAAALKRPAKKGLAAEQKAKSLVYAAISFYGVTPEPGWYDPVQTGSDLYIRSAYLFWQEDGNGYFTEVFFKPVRIGDDLYIRSVQSIWTEGNEANIDTDVFYTPIQTDGDLHLRSVDLFWNDGSEGNVDTDVFFEAGADRQ